METVLSMLSILLHGIPALFGPRIFFRLVCLEVVAGAGLQPVDNPSPRLSSSPSACA